MANWVASALLLNINKYQVVPALLSFLCYLTAFVYSLKVAAVKSLLENSDGTLVRWKVFCGFVIGFMAWRVWIYVSKWLISCELALREQAGTGRGKLLLLGLRAPALTLFPVAGAYISKYFTGIDGTYVMALLAVSVFLIQLTFPYEDDFGSVDTFEGVHLPILPQIHQHFLIVFGISLLYYSRKFVVFLVEEIVKRRRTPLPLSRRQRQRQRQHRKRQNQLLLGLGEDLGIDLIGMKYLRLLVDESKSIVAVGEDEELQRALEFPTETVDADTLMFYRERLFALNRYTITAEEYLDSLPVIV
ncbi:uncharacterized protein [Henckelia pumila]|uniref:uncharacterized protein isoform X1 n=1 Tax=Henckelia pumila TaxID=405737 RepID=UPI003C6E52A8